MSDLIDTTEMYLRTIFELEEEGIVPLRARIAERLGQSGPTVSQTVARMERDGLVVVSGDRHLELTADGRHRATRVMRKHRLAERLLVDVVGLEWEYVHEEACRWEHVMSERVERKILALLDHPTESPYGNPIPGLAELGEAPGQQGGYLQGLVSLVGAAQDEPREVVVRRLGEPVQTDPELMARLAAVGLRPAGRVLVSRSGSGVRLRAAGEPGDGGGAGDGGSGDGAVPGDGPVQGDGAVPGDGAAPGDGPVQGDGAAPGDGTADLELDAALAVHVFVDEPAPVR